MEEKTTIPKKKGMMHWHKITLLLVLYDILAVNLAYGIALWIRFDLHYSMIDRKYLIAWLSIIPAYTIFSISVFYALNLYKSIWRFASYSELYRVIVSSLITTCFHAGMITFLFQKMPASYYIIGMMLQFFAVLGIRFSYRFIILLRESRNVNGNGSNVMLIGAGAAGRMIIRDMKLAREIKDNVRCIIDDNPNKWYRMIEDVPVVGGRDSIFENVQKYNIKKIYLTIPSATAEEKRDILNICKETGCEILQLPGMYQIMNQDVNVSKLKKVEIEDLLGRDPIRTDLSKVMEMLKGKVVLVTGGGGSIGSELCRQIAANDPKQLIIFDIYENNAYAIQLELREKYPDLNLVTLIGSVRDSRKIFDVFKTYHPQIVYHAAAHKHVPLMEDSPCEAIKNNAIGTYKTAYAAMVNGCERFVLISTDKAVNPTNIMGASKRLCEMIIQSFDAKIKEGKANEIPQLFTHLGSENADKTGDGSIYKNIKTEYVAVRFGNVLGSNGSVIPIFEKQIAKGGPVTVTDKNIVRYFMTIAEAVSLVLLAGTYANGGELYVLDMGSEVKIDTLARNLIKLSGYRPDIDIKIEYTGLRPGEKLYEEKLMAEEGLKKTANDLIFIGCPIPFDIEEFLAQLDQLMIAAYQNKENIREFVAKMVNTYHPADIKK